MIKSLLDKLLITCVRVSKRDHYYHPPLDAAILTLPERLRKIIRLYYYERMTMRAIGRLMGVEGSRISQLNRRALRMLREEIGEII